MTKKAFYSNTAIQENNFYLPRAQYWINNGFSMNLMNNYESLIIMTLTERACYVMHAEQYRLHGGGTEMCFI